MSNKTIEIVSDIDLELSLTLHGIGAVITPDNEDAPSFCEYPWDEVIDTLIDSHTIAVLHKKDIRISGSSKQFLVRVAKELRRQALKIDHKIGEMEVIDKT
mgnify:FL=1|jgi:hypothetical protein|tara:strand:- start:33 stop:335 length:303 start_codon:yes stop_codon:yes gene_type:complete